MRCATKTALLLKYSDAAKKHCEAIKEMFDKEATVEESEYDRLRVFGEVAMAETAAAREAMQKHVKMHGC